MFNWEWPTNEFFGEFMHTGPFRLMGWLFAYVVTFFTLGPTLDLGTSLSGGTWFVIVLIVGTLASMFLSFANRLSVYHKYEDYEIGDWRNNTYIPARAAAEAYYTLPKSEKAKLPKGILSLMIDEH